MGSMDFHGALPHGLDEAMKSTMQSLRSGYAWESVHAGERAGKGLRTSARSGAGQRRPQWSELDSADRQFSLNLILISLHGRTHLMCRDTHFRSNDRSIVIGGRSRGE